MIAGPGGRRVAVTGIGLVSPVAGSPADLAAASRPRPRPGPDAQRPWFDPARYLGPRGWKYLSPATRYLLAAADSALAGSGLDTAARPAEQMAVVTGTNFAASPVVARFDRVVLTEGSQALSPAEAPNFSVNIPASELSVRYGMRGFNLTLTNPMVAGLEAILTLASAVRAGRVTAGLAGATEEPPEDDAASGGACCFVLEARDGAPARTELAGGFSRFLPPGDGKMPSAALLAAALGDPLRALVAGHRDGPLPFAVCGAALPRAAGADSWLPGYCADVCASAGVSLDPRAYPGHRGEDFTVSALLQLAGLAADHGHGLVVCASPHGHVAAVYLREGRDEP
jgi:3-oxoacyl-[acyl-carrier-protein] synthase II